MRGRARPATTPGEAVAPGRDPSAAPDHGNAFNQEQLLEKGRPREDIGSDNGLLFPDVGYALPRTAAQAEARWRANFNLVQGVVSDAVRAEVGGTEVNRAVILRNSAQAITDGQVGLALRSPTAADNQPTDAHGPVRYYEATGRWALPSGLPSATVDAPPAEGFALGERLVLVDPIAHPQADARLAETLVHEVHHLLDHLVLPTSDASRPPSRTAEPFAYALYRSEFDAYATAQPDLETQLATPDPRTWEIQARDPVNGEMLTATLRAANRFQGDQASNMIFGSVQPDGVVWENGAWRHGYPWFTWWYCADPAFRRFVDGLTAPRSRNLVNSVRIDRLQERLAAHDLPGARAAAGALDPVDRAVLQGPRAQLALDWLSPADRSDLMTRIAGSGPAPSGATFVTTTGNDTLGELAGRWLGEIERWDDLHAANPTVRLADPPGRDARVLPMQRLRLP